MSGPTLRIRFPPLSLFQFPPHNAPPALPPPSDEATYKSPFPIDAKRYNALLHPAVPLMIASVYIVTVAVVNRYNKQRDWQPWNISKGKIFYNLVLVHNVVLAIYSFLTFLGMGRAIMHAWPEWNSENGIVGVADALCKINGPRGLGDATYYNATLDAWEVKNQLISLAENGAPDSTDVGRIWNEGLAFWGWFFYLSKFYEVVDTFVILAKGRKSSFLQTYHHAGAMLCMWAGIRYMSPPIWMFVFINSFIHSLMYTYYAAAALGVKVSKTLKRTLTTMQIAQFVFGATYAAAHLFVYYDVPVNVPTISRVYSAATVLSEAATAAATTLASPTASAGIGAFLKKLAYRAAGEEGLAENVRNEWGERFGPEAAVTERSPVQSMREEITWAMEYQETPCIDTTGQAFAIWLNLLYLAPLTLLFVRFFAKTYSQVMKGSEKNLKNRQDAAEKAYKEAGKKTEEALDDAEERAEDQIERGIEKAKDSPSGRRVSETIENLQQKFKEGQKETNEVLQQVREKGKENYEKAKANAGPTAEQMKKKAEEWMSVAEKKGQEAKDALMKNGQQAKNKAEKGADSAAETAEEATDKAGQKAEEATYEAGQKAKNAKDEAGRQAKDTKDNAGQKAKEAKDQTGQKASETKDEAGQKAKGAKDEAGEKAEETKDSAKEKASQAKDGAADQAEDVKQKAGDKSKNSTGKSDNKSGNSKGNGQKPMDSSWVDGQGDWDEAKKQGKDSIDKAADTAKQGADKTEKTGKQAADSAKQGADKAAEKTKEGADQAKKGAEKGGEKAKEAANETADQAKQGLDQAENAAKDAASKADQQAQQLKSQGESKRSQDGEENKENGDPTGQQAVMDNGEEHHEEDDEATDTKPERKAGGGGLLGSNKDDGNDKKKDGGGSFPDEGDDTYADTIKKESE